MYIAAITMIDPHACHYVPYSALYKKTLISLKPFRDSNSCTVRAPVFGRHQFFGTSEHYGKAHESLLSGWTNYNYTAWCWFPTSSNILILPSQFWQIRFESYWLVCSKCRILVLLRYLLFVIWDYPNVVKSHLFKCRLAASYLDNSDTWYRP